MDANAPALPGSPRNRHALLHHREVVGLPWPEWKAESFDRVTEESGYIGWWESKRGFSKDEVAARVWTKTCTMGYITELRFHEDGTVDEYTLFDRHHVPGTWQLSADGTLEIILRTDASRYQIEVIASRKGPIHSAIEFQDGVPHAYLKLMQLA